MTATIELIAQGPTAEQVRALKLASECACTCTEAARLLLVETQAQLCLACRARLWRNEGEGLIAELG